MKSTIDTVHGKLNELYSIITPWGEPGDQSTLHARASDEEIARAEAHFGHEFPPSYKQFLRLHSAWEHFWGNATLIGIGAPATQTAQDKILEYREWQTNLLKRRLGELSAANIAAWESKEQQNLYLPNHLVVGVDFSGALWVYDTRTRATSGEMRLTFWEMSYGAQDPTFETFDQFLASWIAEIDFRLEHAERKPRKAPKKAPPKKAPSKKKQTKAVSSARLGTNGGKDRVGRHRGSRVRAAKDRGRRR